MKRKELTFKLYSFFYRPYINFYWNGRFIFSVEVNSPVEGIKYKKHLEEWMNHAR